MNELKIKAHLKPKGLHQLFTKGYELRIKANARLLNENYAQGFCLKSLDQLIDVLDKKCGLVLDPNFIDDNDTVLSLAHVKNDVLIEPTKLLNELMLVGYWSKFQRVLRDNSITYEGTTKTFRQRTTIYSKYNHMIKYKGDYKGLDININDFKGITRIETKFDTSKTVRNQFKTRNMKYILSQKNTNKIIMQNILKGQPTEINEFDLSQFEKLNDEKDYFYIKGLKERFNGNIIAIKAHIRGKTSNPKHQYQKVDKYLPMVNAPRGTALTAISDMKKQLIEN